MSEPPAPPILLASSSPQRVAIMAQLEIPFETVAHAYEEATTDPVVHAVGKARSVAHLAEGRPVLGVDTEVILAGRVYGKPRTPAEAKEMLASLAGETHEVVSGLCLLAEGWEEVHREVTRVTFRRMTPHEVSRYVARGEWEGRAGGYAIQGLGASLVERIAGDYLNVVGLPAALLVRLLARRFPGRYGFG